MALNLVNYEARMHDAVMTFWHNLEYHHPSTLPAGNPIADNPEDTANLMRGFVELVAAIVHANGLEDAQICSEGVERSLPGYFGPTTQWSVSVLYKNRLVAAIGLASDRSPFATDRFDTLIERSVGAAHDFRVAYARGALGPDSRPFTGWLMLVEDAPGSRAPVSDTSRHSRSFRSSREHRTSSATNCSAGAWCVSNSIAQPV